MQRKMPWTTVIVVLVLLAGGWWLLSNGESLPTPSDSTSGMLDDTSKPDVVEVPIPPGPTASASGEMVVVDDQLAGMSVEVRSVNLAGSGWIAVKDNEGWILGAGRFDSGVHENVTVPLLRGTEPGERYQVLLYIDDGDKEFDYKKDSLVIEANGVVAGTTFSAR